MIEKWKDIEHYEGIYKVMSSNKKMVAEIRAVYALERKLAYGEQKLA